MAVGSHDELGCSLPYRVWLCAKLESFFVSFPKPTEPAFFFLLTSQPFITVSNSAQFCRSHKSLFCWEVRVRSGETPTQETRTSKESGRLGHPAALSTLYAVLTRLGLQLESLLPLAEPYQHCDCANLTAFIPRTSTNQHLLISNCLRQR